MRILRRGDSGTDVKEIQAMLNKTGYYFGEIDGIFGSKTEQAVKKFQKNFGLVPDGIIGPKTYKVMERYLLGYDIYTVRAGDSLYNIAKKYYTNLANLYSANPGIDPYDLKIGEQIVVPYGIDVVDTNIDYTYDIMERDIKGLKVRYPFIDVGVAGQSVLGRNLYYIKLGEGKNKVFYNAAHHALEWITSPLLMKFVEKFLQAYIGGYDIKGYKPRDIWNKSTIYIMPMVNPDGVDLVLNGLSKDNPYYNDLIKWNNGSTDFSKNWQSNNKGVDINHNYDAAWEESKEAEEELGIEGPGPTRYSGPSPVSEPETKAVVDFTKKIDPRLALAYHSQGEVIYWDFMNMATDEALKIGEMFSDVSGYKLDKTYGIASFAGYKDWFIQDYGRPGYTIEVGKGKNPLPIEQFDGIYDDNIELLLLASVI